MINLLLFRSTLFWTNQLPLTLIWTELVGGLDVAEPRSPNRCFLISARKAKSQHYLVMFLPPHTLPLCLFLLSVWLRWQCRVPGFSSPPKSFLWLSEDRRITPLTTGMIAYICKTGLKPWTIRCSIFECWGLWFNMHALCLSHIASSTKDGSRLICIRMWIPPWGPWGFEPLLVY